MSTIPKITLDTNNAIISLEDNRADATALKRLLDHNERGEVSLFLTGVSASENLKGGGTSQWYQPFECRVNNAGLGALPVLFPMMRLDFAYLDRSILASDEMIVLEWEIHQILHPSIEHNYQAFLLRSGSERAYKWRNAICDSQALCCHIHYGNDVFISGDTNFTAESKKPKLVALGAGEILSAQEVIDRLDARLTFPPRSDAYNRLKIESEPADSQIPLEFEHYLNYHASRCVSS